MIVHVCLYLYIPKYNLQFQQNVTSEKRDQNFKGIVWKNIDGLGREGRKKK